MEKAVRLFLALSVAIFLLASAAVMYRYLERLGYEAYTPVYIEVPVDPDERRNATPSEVASSSVEASD